MCEPVSATALALSAAGTYLESREAKKNQDRMTRAKNDAYETGMIRQRQYADESGAAFGGNVNNQGREKFDEQKDIASQEVKKAFGDIRVTPTYDEMGGAPASTPKNVVIARQAAIDEANAKTNRDLEGMAGLSGYQGGMFNQNMGNNQFTRLFGNLQDKASRDNRLIPMDMSSAASNASKAPSLFPTLLKGAGMAMGMYGAGSGVGTFGDKPVNVFNEGTKQWSQSVQPGLFTKAKQSAGSFY